jgi:hypothetical protein
MSDNRVLRSISRPKTEEIPRGVQRITKCGVPQVVLFTIYYNGDKIKDD